jgi:ribosomal protein S18 acetylase RimI-like enzyme
MNFSHLSINPNLKHNHVDIERTIRSKDSQIYLYLVNKKIAAYLIGEITRLEDGRNVFYIAYLFTGKKFRKMGFASKLLETAKQNAKMYKLDGVMLTCDSHNSQVCDFYRTRGFMEDVILRTYSRFEVFTQIV